ncbi:hypothetical protein JNUCC0626_18440 [Lentzea sp. JNUCC 0626]|uniref:hypothetical protein n=1 Tax=Lentzea sp. JNUCC 0626 TaxID=3367513 RepID=UPI0037485C74
MRGRDLLDRAAAKRVVEYANNLVDEAGKLTAIERREIADVLQAEGLAVGRWRIGHLASGLLIVGLAVLTILGAIDVSRGTSPSIALVLMWVGAIGLSFVAGSVWKLAGRAIDYPIGMYAVAITEHARKLRDTEKPK